MFISMFREARKRGLKYNNKLGRFDAKQVKLSSHKHAHI